MFPTDAELKALLLRGMAGDGAAHRDFLAGASRIVRAFFRGRMRPAAEDAEDLLQETLMALHTRRASFDPSYPVKAWIYTIARYRMIDHWRRRGRQGTHISIDDADELYTAAEDGAIDAKRDVTRLLAMLPRKQQDAIRLVKLEGVSVSDAAVRMGLSKSDVKTSGHRGIKTLMRRMAEAPA
jgi:RNA polymerase sigma-70 factor (ECF subfamily)